MVRLMLTLTPIVCVSAAVALSSVLDTYIDPTQPDLSLSKDEKVDGTKKDKLLVRLSHLAHPWQNCWRT
ncbi:hypothetical protein V8E52_001028 [Russula decolorans]|jgi:dolichyl-diphosphooligosaccharide--protein glycosyltransferase